MTILFVAWTALAFAVFVAWTGVLSDLLVIVLGGVVAGSVWLVLQTIPHLAAAGTLGGMTAEVPAEHTFGPIAGLAGWCAGTIFGSLMRSRDDDEDRLA